MKITGFHELWKAVNKIKIDVIAKTEIKIFENEGLDTDLSDIYTSSNKEIFTVLKDGSIRKAIVHICDISNYKKEWSFPKFHIFECNTLKNMKINNRKYRYKKASGINGNFWLIQSNKKGYEELEVCGYCLGEYNSKYSTHKSKNNFDIKEYINSSINHIEPTITNELDMTTIPSSYSSDWETISQERKIYYKWICQECFFDLSKIEYKKFLHTHHINADKKNNSYENLKVVCIICHAEEFQHSHIKEKQEYKVFLKIREQNAS